MTHTTIAHRDVNRFEWCWSRKDALNRVAELKRQGMLAYFGGRRAQSRFTYNDIKIAAVHHNTWSGGNMPWVVAWHD